LDDLLDPRDRMIRGLQRTLDPNERRFLLTLAANQPDWSLLKVPSRARAARRSLEASQPRAIAESESSVNR
jgi:hypothetical protein